MPEPAAVPRLRPLLIAFALTTVLLAWAIFLGHRAGKLTTCFGERDLVTWVSAAVLLASGFLCIRLFRVARDDRPRLWITSPALVWLLMGIGFLFLALDETFTLHESLDHLIHRGLHIEETAASDRLDDLIIAGYGVLAVGFLWFYRRQLTRARHALPLLVLGFALMAVMVVGDLASNQDDWVARFVPDKKERQHWIERIEVIEDSAKLYAEVAFLVAAFVALRQLGGTVRCKGKGREVGV